ncbi:hypothetical protein RCO27_02200 [Sphingosinicella sp. LHD-64]|uniref:hypothetical protein n=1 Tax=Sphingosinicella sp. LHD-64 TaxID=3072139 RepID=UPI0028107196|nr:hypothetical protein [Sphingosinicella sp. LHD-64]MDQ8755029.1 hypothetical protein [Sphingosinicella sp. LHD-64]
MFGTRLILAGMLAALGVAGCRPAPETAPIDNGTAKVEADDAPVADLNASLALDQLAGAENHMAAPEGFGGLPPDDRALRFVGRWAAEVGMCRSQAWVFTHERLTTPAGSVCEFGDITPVDGGYDIAARCTAEAPPRDDTIRLRFAESARAMLFESESVAGSGLVYCGPLPAAD